MTRIAVEGLDVPSPPHSANGRHPADTAGAGDQPEHGHVLPDDFWTARPALGHVRIAARARLVSPDALLGAVLTRVCVLADWRIRLPAIVGRTGSLNIAVALAGTSGAGKGSVCDESRQLVGLAPCAVDHRVGEAPAGSGEGMVRAYFDLAADPDDKRRRHLVRTRESLLIRVDEGETLRHLAARQGQTTWQTFRLAFSGEALGNSYVDETRRSRLDPHSYRLALLVGIQPELAGFIFDDVIGGTPQRFLWFATIDPDAPEIHGLPDHPGPIHWRPPNVHSGAVAARMAAGGDGLRQVEMTVAGPIVEELRAHQRDTLLGRDADPLDSHAGLLRLKVAGLLAVFDGRIAIDLDDWRLAGQVTTTSGAVRQWMLDLIAADGRRRDYAANERAAERAARVENAKAAAGVDIGRVAAVIARHVHKHGADEHGADTEGCNRRCVSRAVRSTDRDQFDAALGLAIANGWVVEGDDGLYLAGDSRPA